MFCLVLFANNFLHRKELLGCKEDSATENMHPLFLGMIALNRYVHSLMDHKRAMMDKLEKINNSACH